MNKAIMLNAPTAKLTIGNQLSAELDTATLANGKKSLKFTIITDGDTTRKEIDVEGEDAKDALQDIKDEFIEIKETRRDDNMDNGPHFNPSMLVPIIAIVFGVSYAAFSSYQKRKWREAMLNKGISPEEIMKEDNKNILDFGSNKEGLEGYESRKMMKWIVILGSFGLSVLLASAMDEGGYFFGFFPLFLASGFYYIHKGNK